MLDVTLAGTGGTVPSHDRKLAACVMRFNGSVLLIDCGEGTQLSVKDAGYQIARTDVILITHFHADHTAGLPGYLLSMGNEGRTQPLTIAGPAGTENVVNSLRVIAPELPFEIRYTEWQDTEDCAVIGSFHINAFALSHSVPCYGYLVSIPRAGKFDTAKALANDVPMALWSKLQNGENVEYGGIVYTGDMVLGAARRGISVCYATDTRPVSAIVRMATGTDLFICEGMFADDEKRERADATGHMTFSDAARLASQACPDRFILTHFSPSLQNPDDFSSVAKNIFPDTVCGYDGITVNIGYKEY